MTGDARAAALEHLEWEADHRRAAMDVAIRRADAAEAREAEQQRERQAAGHPAPDPEYLAFMARMTGQPGPLDLDGVFAKHAMMAPAEGPSRDVHAEYGTAANPARFVGWREVPPPVIRRDSNGWEYEAERLIARNRELDLWMTGYLVRHDYPAALARARAKQSASGTNY